MKKQRPPAAMELARRRKEGKTGPLLPGEQRPQTFTDAFMLQQAVGEQYAGVSASAVAGWKCALPSDDKTVIGALYANTLQTQANEPVTICKLHADADGLAVVEPELAFELKQHLPPRDVPYSESEIDAAIGKTRLALELIQSRYEHPEQATFFDALADGLVNQGLWLGPELAHHPTQNLSEFSLTICYANGHVGTKPATHPNKNPRAGLYWLVNFLSKQGIGMRQGQQVITGSYAGVLKLQMGQPITLNYGDLGQFTVQFEAE